MYVILFRNQPDIIEISSEESEESNATPENSHDPPTDQSAMVVQAQSYQTHYLNWII